MRRRNASESVRCGCGRMTTNPRRGQCERCYMTAYHGRERADSCAACTHADPRHLVRRTVRVDASSSTVATICGNCSVLLGRRPIALEQLRIEAQNAA